MKIKVVGAGLAGVECAYTLSQLGYKVELYDIKPNAFTPAHSSKNFGELVCSNSLKSNDVFGNACGLLKEEMRILGSLTMMAAEISKVGAGSALAVDRDVFSQFITEKIEQEKNITIVSEEIKSIPNELCVIATGPLTYGDLAEDINAKLGGGLHFFDASAPIVTYESLDKTRCFVGDRYGKGNGDYVNCPMNKDEYLAFIDALKNAERAKLHDFEKREIFEGCMPIEIMAQRGDDTLRFGPLKPVGLSQNGEKHYAVLQLRKENVDGDMLNLVGFQTNLKFGEQKRVFSLIPALKNAEFVKYGVMHRNSYINSPIHLNDDMSLKKDDKVFFAGQITGVEGYVESAASGIAVALNIHQKISKNEIVLPSVNTMLGALLKYVVTPNKNFQPMNANFGILPPLENNIRDKKVRYKAYAERALNDMQNYKVKILW